MVLSSKQHGQLRDVLHGSDQANDAAQCAPNFAWQGFADPGCSSGGILQRRSTSRERYQLTAGPAGPQAAEQPSQPSSA